KAMQEVSGPVVAIALVLSSVFVPVAFVPGITGRMYQQFALTIASSVIISGINALPLSPALSALLLRPGGTTRGPLGRFYAAFNRGFARVTEGYVGWTHFAVRRSARTLLMLGVLTGGALLLGWRPPGGLVPHGDPGYLFVNVQLPDAASMERTDAVCKQVEAILEKTPGVGDYNTIAGYSLIAQSSATYNAFFFVSLDPWQERHTAQTGFQGTLNAQSSAPTTCFFCVSREPWHERHTEGTGFKGSLNALNRQFAAIPAAQV